MEKDAFGFGEETKFVASLTVSEVLKFRCKKQTKLLLTAKSFTPTTFFFDRCFIEEIKFVPLEKYDLNIKINQ